MGKTYPTTKVCGLEGRLCQLREYPKCDGTMRGVRPLPEEAPAEKWKVQKWVDHWVGTVKEYGGICSLPKGMWGVYFNTTQASQPQPEPQPESKPQSPPAASAPPAQSKNEGTSFDPLKFIESVRQFGEGLVPKEDREQFQIRGALGTAAVAFLIGAYVLFRMVKKKSSLRAVKTAAKKPAPPPPSPPKQKAQQESPNFEIAQRLQRMLAVHLIARDDPKYSPLSRDEKVWKMRVTGDAHDELADPVKARTLAMQYDALLGQIDGLKTVKDGMDRVDTHALARALLLEQHMMIVDKSWDSVVRRFSAGASQLMGPVPPDWIINIVKERGWGIDGKGDPFVVLIEPQGPQSFDVPGSMRGDDSNLSKTRGNSAFWNQVITCEWFQALDPIAQDKILSYHVEIQAALHEIYSLPEFKRRHVPKKGFISEEGLQYIVVETLQSREVNTRLSPGLAALQRPDEKRDRDWLPECRRILQGKAK